MKKAFTILGILGVLFSFNSCSKETPEPLQEPLVQTDFVTGTCTQYHAYDGGRQQNLGNLLNNRILIGFKKGTNQAKKLKVISGYSNIAAIISTSYNNGDDYTDVMLHPNLACADVEGLLQALVLDNHVDFVGPYFIGNFGVGNMIEVVLASSTSQAQFNNLLTQTKSEYLYPTNYGAHIIRTTRHSPKNCLETANQLYETGLFDSAIPNWNYFVDD